MAYSLKSVPILQNIYNSIYRLKNKKSFLRAIRERERISIFDYKELIKPLPYCPLEKIKDSNFYGYVHNLKHYIGNTDAHINIEHGLYLDNYVSYFSNFKTFETIMTFSPYRTKTLRKHGVKKRILEIGPYIHYVTPLLSIFEIEDIKEKYGKILLFMPNHSTNTYNGTSPIFEKDIKEVNRLKEVLHCDSVFVCIYYRDFKYEKYINRYLENGFIPITAGHQLDLNFASRLKSIISLADHVAVNSVGTNLGFCIAMGKPLTYINLREESFNKKLSGYSIRKAIAELFSIDQSVITPQQYDIVNKYWGLDCIKSPEQINSFLKGK